MNFVRVKKRGQDQKVHKTWMPEGSLKLHTYRITWAKEVFGVKIKPHYHATVWTFRNLGEDHKQWTFAGRRGPYKTFEAAVEACEKHEKAWLALIEASEGDRTGRNDRLRSIEFRSRVKFVRDKKTFHQKTLTSLPVWARPKVNSILQSFLFPQGRKRATDDECDEIDLTPTSNSSDSASLDSSPLEQESSGPASAVTAEATTESPPVSTKSKRKGKSAAAAKEPAKAPAKRARKSTAKSSDTGSLTTSKSDSVKPSVKAGSRSSRRKSA